MLPILFFIVLRLYCSVFIDKTEEMEIEKEGSIIIQGKYILDIVRKLPDEFINIEVIDELKITIYINYLICYDC